MIQGLDHFDVGGPGAHFDALGLQRVAQFGHVVDGAGEQAEAGVFARAADGFGAGPAQFGDGAAVGMPKESCTSNAWTALHQPLKPRSTSRPWSMKLNIGESKKP